MMLVASFHQMLVLFMQVSELNANLSQIGFDFEMIHKLVTGLVS